MRRIIRPIAPTLLALATTLAAAGCAIVGQQLTQTGQEEIASIVEGQIDGATPCAVDDPECAQATGASAPGITDVDAGGDAIGDAPAGYDFVPGDETLFFDDFGDDGIGGVPRRLEPVSGDWEVVEWGGRRLLRNTGPQHAAFRIPLPRDLPVRFTIELEVHFRRGSQQLVITTAAPAPGAGWRDVGGSAIRVGAGGPTTGVVSANPDGAESTDRTPELTAELVPIRIMVDGTHASVYAGRRRVSDITDAEFARGDAIYVENTYSADEGSPTLIGPIRVAAGGTSGTR